MGLFANIPSIKKVALKSFYNLGSGFGCTNWSTDELACLERGHGRNLVPNGEKVSVNAQTAISAPSNATKTLPTLVPSTTSNHPFKAAYVFREATASDASTIVDLILPHVSHDGFHDFFFPYQDEYPQDFRLWWKRYYRNMILQPYIAIMLAERVEMDVTGKENKREIVGLAGWIFAPRGSEGEKGQDGPEPKGIDLAKNSLLYNIQRKYYKLKDRMYDKYHGANRSIDPEALKKWRSSVNDLRSRIWAGTDRIHWYSPELIDFTQEKNGKPEDSELFPYLVGWGIDQAEIDGLPTFVVCGRDETEFYVDEGFKEVAEAHCGPLTVVAMKFSFHAGEKH